MDNILAILAETDPRFIIGWTLLSYGSGIITACIAWAVQSNRAQRKMETIISEALNLSADEIVKSIGHVIGYHPCGVVPGLVHAHCICGETSLDFAASDPASERLMEQWADNHINSLMESSGR